MKKINSNLSISLTRRVVALAGVLALCIGLASCSNNDESTHQADAAANAAGMKLLQGIRAEGELGKKPSVTMQTPLNVENNTYAILQHGNGATIQDGDRVCAHGIVLGAKDGKELMNSWKKNRVDCSLVVDSTMNKSMYALLKGKKLNTTVAFGVKGRGSIPSYVMVFTMISKRQSLTRATGNPTSNIPADLPKVTLDKTGKPSLDLNGYTPNGKLVSQNLIDGKGSTVQADATVNAHYTGWTLDKSGKLKQFDSSWDRKQAANFSLNQVVAGWKKGLAGKKIGSQVLLVIPPEEGYGKDDKKDAQGNVIIPGNSTLYFVVDILDAF